jgi:hypothetical protein
MIGSIVDQRIFEELMKAKLPHIAEHLDEAGTKSCILMYCRIATCDDIVAMVFVPIYRICTHGGNYF